MSYVLDGIPTAMVVKQGREIECPCGEFVASWDARDFCNILDEVMWELEMNRVDAALRFHYQWCSAAKVTK